MPTTSRSRGAQRTAPAGLTKAEQALLAELEAKRDAAATGLPREITTRERVISTLMADRHHFDGCPSIADKSVAAARTEAYPLTRPADPTTARPEQPFVVVRCMECGGSTNYPDVATPDALIESTLRQRAADAADTDGIDATL